MFHVQVASMSTNALCRHFRRLPVNLFDPRLGRYLANPDISDAELELTTLLGKDLPI